MAEVNNKTCSICGKGYYLCLACKNQKATPWKVYTDTSEHYKIHQVIRGYESGVYTKEEAKEKLNTIDLTGLNSFVPEVKTVIKKILVDNQIKKKTSSKVVEDKAVETEK